MDINETPLSLPAPGRAAQSFITSDSSTSVAVTTLAACWPVVNVSTPRWSNQIDHSLGLYQNMETTSSVLAELRRESQSIFNRIHSITEDAAFVKQVHGHYPDFPLLPNMRCGAWYTDPEITSPERAYFKSTDGHTNNWSFNLRRPNLHILSLLAQHAGLVLVDSTRAGKRIPDALSKTVPIWCTVVNRAILNRAPEIHPLSWDTALYTSPGSVSPQEHSHIEGKLDGWAARLATSSYSLPTLDRPLRPIWITPATTVFPTFPKPPDCAFYPIICVSASKQVMDGMERRASGFAYIQGSGDDHELWSMVRIPSNRQPGTLSVCSSQSRRSSHTDDPTDPNQLLCATPIQYVSGRISISTIASLQRPHLLQAHPAVAFVCLALRDHDLDPNPAGPATEEASESSKMLRIQTPEGKKGQRHFLTVVLPRAMPFIQRHLQDQRTVCIACNTGTDTSVGVAVAALAMFFRPDGSLCAQGNARADISKDVLKTRLQWIIASYPQANPSRTTLKRINDFLLSPFSNLSTLGSNPGGSDPRTNETTIDIHCQR
ncbi:initiator tRNA phosphoribosyl transferase [Boletus reticuloceps]|uniref:Initiator tRNA phosphoribosyl transferase n=1 Tax=Boletus reticuloceps TaxID=495285 RepID=A0A8I3ADX1_9AGAM|nr:initiator tRNA phosphoribosyl transferase [Boletus reticuloceps]